MTTPLLYSCHLEQKLHSVLTHIEVNFDLSCSAASLMNLDILYSELDSDSNQEVDALITNLFELSEESTCCFIIISQHLCFTYYEEHLNLHQLYFSY